MSNTYPRETVEFQAIYLTVDGVPVTVGVETCVTAPGERPATWATAAEVGDAIGVMVEDFEPGVWEVWARTTSNPETPVVSCGTFTVT